jgi:hypothetical protein
MLGTKSEPEAMSFAGLKVQDGAVVGADKVLDLYDATALIGGVEGFPRHIRTVLSPDTVGRDDWPQLVVFTPSGVLLHRRVAPESENQARTFARHLNVASAEMRRS